MEIPVAKSAARLDIPNPRDAPVSGPRSGWQLTTAVTGDLDDGPTLNDARVLIWKTHQKSPSDIGAFRLLTTTPNLR